MDHYGPLWTLMPDPCMGLYLRASEQINGLQARANVCRRRPYALLVALSFSLEK